MSLLLAIRIVNIYQSNLVETILSRSKLLFFFFSLLKIKENNCSFIIQEIFFNSFKDIFNKVLDIIKKCTNNNQQQPSTCFLITFVIVQLIFSFFHLPQYTYTQICMYVCVCIYTRMRHSYIRDVYLFVCFVYVCTRGVDTSSEK